MPIYEYQCSECGHGFEVLQGINDKPSLKCENCNGDSVQRVLSAGAFVFKGSGFYATDYKVKDQKKEKAEAPSCEACAQAGGCPAAKNPE